MACNLQQCSVCSDNSKLMPLYWHTRERVAQCSGLWGGKLMLARNKRFYSSSRGTAKPKLSFKIAKIM